MSKHVANEPVVNAQVVSSAVTVVVAIVAAVFGVHVAPDQQDVMVGAVTAVVALVSVVGQLVAAVKARGKVKPVE